MLRTRVALIWPYGFLTGHTGVFPLSLGYLASFLDYRVGWMPDTFAGLEDRTFCFAHIDVDLYSSIMTSCKFMYPRMSRGGSMVFHDYGFPSCPGARQAVDEFFLDKPEEPLVLQTGQVVVCKL